MFTDLAGSTHIGLTRKENQDGFLATRFGDPEADAAFCLAVADGMGGHQEGRRASEEAIWAVQNSLRAIDRPERKFGDWVRCIAEDAHRTVSHIASPGQVVGTTLTVAFVQGDSLVIGHVGDSRVYRWRGGQLACLTHDHTWEAYCQENGIENPYGRSLRQAVGVGEGVEVETVIDSLSMGDRILVCSDGLYKMVSEAQIARVLKSAESASAGCKRLVELALAAGGKDNVTVCLGMVGVAEVDPQRRSLLVALVVLVILFVAWMLWILLR